MAELKVKIPNELESEFKVMSDIEVSIFVSRVLKDKLSRLVKFKRAVSKSELTQAQADELANEVSASLANRYDKLLSKR